MTPTNAQDLLRRALAVLERHEPEMADAPSTIPVADYLDAERFERERTLLRRWPQPVAAADVLRAPGSHVSTDRLGVPLLVVRGDDGVLRAFVNVCRHRGARIVPPGTGQGSDRFACPYHAWTYGLDGRLRGVPQQVGFPSLDREAAGLRPLAVTERAGAVWVVPDTRCAAIDAGALLAPLADELDTMGFGTHAGFDPRTIERRCNWKLLADGSFEAYHFKVAHRATIAQMFADNVQIVDELGPHRRLFLVKASLDPTRPPAAEHFQPRQHGNLIYFFFPNTFFLVQVDHAQLSSVEPLAPETTRVHELTLIPDPPATDKALGHWQRNVALYRATLAEDHALAESIQAGLASGANSALTFGRFEFAAVRFHAQLDAALRSDVPG
ncbi:aromatic ring-hydroxylating oxygenase subunit alpha [Aquabacterium humicola]|uniref:aromatic ring-hydroxylating oxygenase subunit alpha n=1 Tax=Aquabacterium humicola TaxID=3237377 RepID=UPI002543039B|nr:aromatic ring-hydroxylating dioxygenase subunit alpha [Rubrivivax pictus]